MNLFDYSNIISRTLGDPKKYTDVRKRLASSLFKKWELHYKKLKALRNKQL